jgi:hypothetical protein
MYTQHYVHFKTYDLIFFKTTPPNNNPPKNSTNDIHMHTAAARESELLDELKELRKAKDGDRGQYQVI